MKLRVSFLGTVQNYSGVPEAELEVPESSEISQLFSILSDNFPKIREISKFLFVSVNKTMSARNRILGEGDEVELFFRIGGG